MGNFLEVQWLGLQASTAEGIGSIPRSENWDPASRTAWRKEGRSERKKKKGRKQGEALAKESSWWKGTISLLWRPRVIPCLSFLHPAKRIEHCMCLFWFILRNTQQVCLCVLPTPLCTLPGRVAGNPRENAPRGGQPSLEGSQMGPSYEISVRNTLEET